MLFRFVFILLCVVGFINSCNSVISLQFGTHKLRSITVAEIENGGLGDADFIEITDAHLSGEFIHAKGTKKEDGGLIIYPILNEQALAGFEKGKKAKTAIFAWTDIFVWECLEEKSCAPKGKTTVKGVIRTIYPEKDKSSDFATQFEFTDTAIFLEAGREPTPWYQHILVMILTAGGILVLEIWRLKREEKSRKQAPES